MKRGQPEAARELLAASMRRGGDLYDGLTHSQPRPGGDVVLAQVEVDVQLVTGQRRTGIIASDETGKPRVDDSELP